MTVSWLDERRHVAVRVDGSVPLTDELVREVSFACAAAEDASNATVVVLQLTGGQRRLWPGTEDIGLITRWERALRRLERCPAATIAVIEGGVALEVALATDYRISAPDARFGLPVVGGQIWPGMALHRLAQQFGVAVARRFSLFGDEITAMEALRIGLVDEVTPALGDAAAAAVDRGAAQDGSELAIRRRLVLDAVNTTFEDALGAHLSACDRLLRRTTDVR